MGDETGDFAFSAPNALAKITAKCREALAT
jgi:hypothetical protein